MYDDLEIASSVLYHQGPMDTYICSLHFVGGHGPTEDHPDPVPATLTPEQVERFSRTKRRLPFKQRQQDPKCVKALFQHDTTRPVESDNYDTPEPVFEFDSLEEVIEVAEIYTETKCSCACHHPCRSCACPAQVMVDAQTQTVYDKYMLSAKVETIILRNQTATKLNEDKRIELKPTLSLDDIKHDAKKMQFFTGVTILNFTALMTFLGDCVNHLKYWGDKHKVDGRARAAASRERKTRPADELFITLVRLRRGYCYQALSHFFCLSSTRLSCICNTWVQLLFKRFDSLRQAMFPPRSHFRNFMPACFRSFKNIRCVIDCTEFFVQTAKDFQRQGNMFSNYKHHQTVKCLIAVAPNGAAVFVSDLYEGSISDRAVFEQCGILDHILPGDLVLADRGFNVRDLLLEKGATLNIPPFLKGRDRLSPEEELLTRRIAKARIHVERFNERLKKFRILKGNIPLSLDHMINQALFVCCCLVNFEKELVKTYKKDRVLV